MVKVYKWRRGFSINRDLGKDLYDCSTCLGSARGLDYDLLFVLSAKYIDVLGEKEYSTIK